MLALLIGIGLFVVLPGLYALMIHNLLVTSRARVRESWSNVDVELQRRHDLIPRLCETVRGYAEHERGLLERLTELRTEAERLRPGLASLDQARVETELSGAMHQLLVRVEAYPELRASENFSNLASELAHIEDRIASALRFFNSNVRDLNVRCETIPSNLLASMFGFERAEYFQIEPAVREAPRASLG